MIGGLILCLKLYSFLKPPKPFYALVQNVGTFWSLTHRLASGRDLRSASPESFLHHLDLLAGHAPGALHATLGFMMLVVCAVIYIYVYRLPGVNLLTPDPHRRLKLSILVLTP